MKFTKIYNVDLLRLISLHDGITVDELRELYILPEPKGVVYGSNVMFESDLAVLESEGYIRIKDGRIQFVHRKFKRFSGSRVRRSG